MVVILGMVVTAVIAATEIMDTVAGMAAIVAQTMLEEVSNMADLSRMVVAIANLIVFSKPEALHVWYRA